MEPKRNHVGSSRATRKLNRTEEWVESISDEAALNQLVAHGMLPDRATTGWLAAGESFPTPCGDELVVFENYFYHGFGVLIHPFLCGLIDYYGISLCNLSPNSILHVSVFIHFCKAYNSILPYFNLFRHFFCLKAQGDLDLGS
jgi:hypothetical protein